MYGLITSIIRDESGKSRYNQSRPSVGQVATIKNPSKNRESAYRGFRGHETAKSETPKQRGTIRTVHQWGRVSEDLKELGVRHFGFPVYKEITTREVANSRNATGPTTIVIK